MDAIIQTLLAVSALSGLTAIILALLQRRWSKADKRDAVVAGLKVLTVDRVRYLGKCYIADGKITLEDKENLQDMYRAYKDLGGNGHLETVMAEVNHLPITGRWMHEQHCDPGRGGGLRTGVRVLSGAVVAVHPPVQKGAHGDHESRRLAVPVQWLRLGVVLLSAGLSGP